jgi:predicted ATPase
LDVFNPGERAMTGPTITELDQRIALIRENINELVEQAAAYSGAADENRTADRIAQQEQELAKLIKLRDALLRR